MGLFEFIGEAVRPGKIGTIKIKKGKKEKRIILLIAKTILSVAMISFIYCLIFGISFRLKECSVFIAILAIYSISGYFVSAKPDYSNVGWFGGFVDNPFKISDDVNRMIVFFMVMLIPGKLISTTVVSWIHLLKSTNKQKNK